VVDDLEMFRQFISTTLESRMDLNVIGEASDGLEAVQMAGELKPDLILLDIGLPGLNGIEAARRIRSASPKSRIIFVSQEFSVEIVQQAFSVGAWGYVVKMDAGLELLAAVDAVLRDEQFVGRRFAGHDFFQASDIKPSDGGTRENFRSKSVLASPLEGKGIGGRHEVGFYSDDLCLLDELTQFIGAALRVGNAAIVIATKSHRDSILPRLQARGFDVGAAIKEGRYTAVDAADTLSTFMVNGTLESGRYLESIGNLILKAENSAKGEPRRVAFFGEGVDLLWKQGNPDAAVQNERLCNQLTKRYDVDILCGYSLDSLQGGMEANILQQICAEHSAVRSR
jgi:CheY-like chemotaxis protein